MDPQLKSILSSIFMSTATLIATVGVTDGIIPGSQRDSAANIIVSLMLYGVSAGLALYKKAQHSPQALIDAINEPPNGLKVVAVGEDVAAVTAPLKAIALLFAVGLALLAFGGDARADVFTNALRQNAANHNGTAVGDMQPVATTPLGGSNVFDDIANWIGGDLTAAETLATQNPELQDWTGQACWKAAETFSNVLKAHPIPVSLHAATDAEALRLAMASAKQLCQNSACQTLSGDLLGGIAQMGIGIPAPVTLQTLCAKIPSITLGVAPSPLPSVTPAPVAK